LISGPVTLIYFGLILLVAIGGKFCGAFFASRLSGMSWREADSIGVLMNTRGMVELVALNIGMDIGVISHLVFTLLVLMAIITTCMTTPLLDLVYPVNTTSLVLLELGRTISQRSSRNVTVRFRCFDKFDY